MVRITIDEHKCKVPRECRRCLEVCPESVFMIYPRKPRSPGKKAANWVIVPVHLTLCTACGVCVEACPRYAITLAIEI